MPQVDDRDIRTRTTRGSAHIQDVKNVATYPTPILAMLQGRSVRLIATGDAPGHSPVLQYIDETGMVQWEEQDLFVVIDTAFLPVSQETLRQVIRNTNRNNDR